VVDTAAGAREGFNKATSLPFDLIILDLMLPDRSGLDICQTIREAGIATSLIVLSARHQTTDKVVALKLGLTTTSPSRSSRSNPSLASRLYCGACLRARAMGSTSLARSGLIFDWRRLLGITSLFTSLHGSSSFFAI
jgi:CheY-like chemotaxis protein